MKPLVLGLSGSLRADGFTNKALAVALEGAARAGARTVQIDLNLSPLPLFDGSPAPASVLELRRQLHKASGILLATPEYHGSYSGVLKNALDWMSAEQFDGKPIGLVGVSGGALGALGALMALREVGRALHAWVVPDQASIGQAWSAFDDHGELRNPELQARLHQVGRQVARFPPLALTA